MSIAFFGLIFITPRSFASGNYFKLFREKFFKIIEIEKVHIFTSRNGTFKRDKILQETIIIKGKRKEKVNPLSTVYISNSNDLQDINELMRKEFKHKDIIDLNSKDRILHIPINDDEENILKIFKSWSGNLKKYDINISTGPVVAFRNIEFIIKDNNYIKSPNVPLLWLHNVKPMTLEWPLNKNGKGQYIECNQNSKHVLIPNKNYIFLRRFSAKEDKSRLVAAPYLCNFNDYEFLGVENKLNYIYRKNGHLESKEVMGLCALLNSRLFDVYFRTFNGNINVSATELRQMPLPPFDIILEIGDAIISSNDYSIDNVNKVINDKLNIFDNINE